MFVRPKETIKSVLEGVLEHGKLPRDVQNEYFKNYLLEIQAGVNERLARHKPICLALGEECRKERCEMYKDGIGKDEKGWACEEFQVDHPTALFNLRFHVTFIGDDKIDKEKTKQHLEYLKEQGAKYFCEGCSYVYKEKPRSVNESGCGGKTVYRCCCGSKTFFSFGYFVRRFSLDE